jgi:predicted membrane channel-forming protein YqfA (hemolysin III family)
MKIVIAFALVAIVVALLMAGRAMVKDTKNSKQKNKSMVNALTWRIGLSVALFLFVLLANYLGWIQPTGIAAGQ